MAEKSSEISIIGGAENEIEAGAMQPAVNQSPAAPETDAEISDDPEEIREQIENTRREMGETIEAIQEKLSFSHISEQVREQVGEQIGGAVENLKTTISDSVIGKAGKIMNSLGKDLKKSNLAKAAGNNPFPLVLIGLGVSLLLFGGRKKSGGSNYEQYRYQGGGAKPAGQTSTLDKVGETAGNIYQGIGDSASSAYQGASQAASSAYKGVSEAAGSAYHKVGDVGGELRGSYEHYLETNPLAVGAVALALGAAVGLAIPATDYESGLFGEARENLLSKAEDTARGAFDKVRDVVEQVKETVTEEAGRREDSSGKSNNA